MGRDYAPGQNLKCSDRAAPAPAPTRSGKPHLPSKANNAGGARLRLWAAPTVRRLVSSDPNARPPRSHRGPFGPPFAAATYRIDPEERASTASRRRPGLRTSFASPIGMGDRRRKWKRRALPSPRPRPRDPASPLMAGVHQVSPIFAEIPAVDSFDVPAAAARRPACPTRTQQSDVLACALCQPMATHQGPARALPLSPRNPAPSAFTMGRRGFRDLADRLQDADLRPPRPRNIGMKRTAWWRATRMGRNARRFETAARLMTAAELGGGQGFRPLSRRRRRRHFPYRTYPGTHAERRRAFFTRGTSKGPLTPNTARKGTDPTSNNMQRLFEENSRPPKQLVAAAESGANWDAKQNDAGFGPPIYYGSTKPRRWDEALDNAWMRRDSISDTLRIRAFFFPLPHDDGHRFRSAAHESALRHRAEPRRAAPHAS